MKNLYLIGGGGHCHSCIDVIEQENKYQIKGIFDLPDKIDKEILGYKVIGTDKEIESYIREDNYFLVTIGQIGGPNKRLEYSKLNLATVISPRAYVSKNSIIGHGSIIMHDVIINSNAKIGYNCIINSKALIEHDAIIENHCHISTGSIVNGGAMIRRNTFFGSNSMVKENVVVEKNSVIKGGSIILK